MKREEGTGEKKRDTHLSWTLCRCLWCCRCLWWPFFFFILGLLSATTLSARSTWANTAILLVNLINRETLAITDMYSVSANASLDGIQLWYNLHVHVHKHYHSYMLCIYMYSVYMYLSGVRLFRNFPEEFKLYSLAMQTLHQKSTGL